MHPGVVLFQHVHPSWPWVRRRSKGTSTVPDPSWHKGSPIALGLNPVGSKRRRCWVLAWLPWGDAGCPGLGAGRGYTPASGRACHLPRTGGGCIPALPGAGGRSSKGWGRLPWALEWGDAQGTQLGPSQARAQSRQQGWLVQTCSGQGGARRLVSAVPSCSQHHSDPAGSAWLWRLPRGQPQGSVG